MSNQHILECNYRNGPINGPGCICFVLDNRHSREIALDIHQTYLNYGPDAAARKIDTLRGKSHSNDNYSFTSEEFDQFSSIIGMLVFGKHPHMDRWWSLVKRIKNRVTSEVTVIDELKSCVTLEDI